MTVDIYAVANQRQPQVGDVWAYPNEVGSIYIVDTTEGGISYSMAGQSPVWATHDTWIQKVREQGLRWCFRNVGGMTEERFVGKAPELGMPYHADALHTSSDTLALMYASMRVSQRRFHSWLETIANTSIGLAVSVFAQWAIFPLFGIHVPTSANIGIAACFTVISIVRSCAMRRLFNWWHVYLETRA